MLTQDVFALNPELSIACTVQFAGLLANLAENSPTHYSDSLYVCLGNRMAIRDRDFQWNRTTRIVCEMLYWELSRFGVI